MPPVSRVSCLLLCILLVASNVSASTGDIFSLGLRKFEKRSEKALARGFETIIEAPDGQIIIGGQVGLYTYFGDELTPIKLRNKEHDEKLSLTYIEKLRIDGQQMLWVFSKSDGVFKINLNNRKSNYYPPFESKPQTKTHISDAHFDGERITVITKHGPFDFNPDTKQYTPQLINAPKIREASPVFTLLEPKPQRPAMLISAEHGLLIYKDKQWQQYPVGHEAHQAFAEQAPIFAIMDSNENIWSTSHSGPIHRLKEGGIEKLALPHEMAIHILEFNDEIWIPTLRSGILILDKSTGKLKEHIKADQKVEHSIPEDDIVQLLLDRSGMLWIASKFKGLWVHNTQNKSIRSLLTSDDPKLGLLSNRPIEVLERKNGDLWVIYIGKGIDVIRPGLGIVERFEIGKGNHQLNSGSAWLGETSKGTMIVGAIKSAPQIYNETDKTFTSINVPPELSGKGSYVGFIDHKDRIIASYPEWYQYDINEEQWQSLSAHAHDGESKLGFGHYYSDRDGALWASDNTSIFNIDLDNNTVKKLRLHLANGVEPQTGSIYDFLEDDTDGLIISSTIGFFRLSKTINKDKVQVTELPLLDDISSLGNIPTLHSWQGNQHWSPALSYNSATGQATVLGAAYGQKFEGIWYGRTIKTRDGTLISPGPKGLSLLKPQLFETWEYQPPLIITKRRVAGEDKVAPYGDIHVPPERNFFSVSFIALDYSAKNTSQYRYRLEGFEDDWHLGDASMLEATYTNIPPGKYTLNIQGSNRLGQWSPLDQRINVYVASAWYQETWFYLLCLLGALLSIYLLVLVRTRHLKQRERELSQQVQLRTRELEASLIELKETQGALVESEKHASLGRLIYGLSHEINTPLGIITMSQSMLGEGISTLQTAIQDKDLQNNYKRMSASLELAQSNTKKVSKLMETFKQISTKEFSDEKVDVKVRDVIEEAFSISSQSKFDINCSIECEENMTFISNQAILRDVLKELIENSIYHGFDGAPSEDAYIKVTATLTTQLAISIQDNGCGMNSEDAKRVFDPFFSAGHKQDHIGLGLHIVYNKVTQLLGGSIQCQSSEQTGCTMILEIPNK
ncbi:ATP-binding protein [uncultured Pseudoteredinibacter sp.]|uniref:sensor histidine kinase n=1 Tax=uncultured Pseudoteredinibacter sp. TaxID=1641701 RepID=UPI0026245B59|nr:ATP-binding protein [uncultured Pseudoteredinibacter sp.]